MDQITGCFDGITGGSIKGWIANLTHPGNLEQVVCRGANGASFTFLAFLHRPDVGRALRLPGRFGFAMPIAALQYLGAVIDITDIHGRVLPQGAAVKLPTAPAARAPDCPRQIVLHIPKTAGTSLRVALMAAFAPGETVPIYPDRAHGISVDELAEMPFAQREAFRLMVGHTPFGIDRYLPGGAEYVTVLRDPKARLLSNYNHHVAQKLTFPVGDTDYPTWSVVQQGLAEEFDNMMTRRLAGVTIAAAPLGSIGWEDVEMALHNIRSRFRFVGRTDHLREDYPTLCRIMGIPGSNLPMENVTRTDRGPVAGARVDWAEVMYRNRFDVMLYQRVQAEGLCGVDLARDRNRLTPGYARHDTTPVH